MTHSLTVLLVLALAKACLALPIHSCHTIVDSTYSLLIPDSEDCTVFYICLMGRPVRMQCLPGQTFNPSLKMCESSGDGGCVQSILQQKRQSDVNMGTSNEPELKSPHGPQLSQDRVCSLTDDFTVYPHTDDCSKYHVCENGVLVINKCPRGLHFNPQLKVCNIPTKARCHESILRKRLSSVTIMNDALLSALTKCISSEEGGLILLPNPKNCSEYIACSNDKLVIMACPTGLYFNPNLSVCDFPQNVDCKHLSKVLYYRLLHNVVKKSYTICPPPGEDSMIILPDYRFCSRYQICENGILISRPCPHGLEFNPIAKICDDPGRAGCSKSPKTNISFPPSKYLNTTICPPPGEGDLVLLPDPKNCSQYFACDNGELTVLPCAPGLHFSQEFNVCVLPEDAKCTEKPSRIFHKNSFKNNCPPPGEGDLVLLPDPNDCAQYFVCDNGELVALSCAPGLHFSQELKVCVLPSDAGCTEKEGDSTTTISQYTT